MKELGAISTCAVFKNTHVCVSPTPDTHNILCACFHALFLFWLAGIKKNCNRTLETNANYNGAPIILCA